jgi:hypothetical protein
MLIGKIVSSSSHVEYLCQVYGAGEADPLPQPADYGFGAFVAIERSDGAELIGVIYNTTLMNPEFGSLGPRLSSQEDLRVFSPDYIAERVTLVAVVALGARGPGEAVRQGVPAVATTIDACVRRLDADEICAFHRIDGGLQLAYLPMLTAMGSPLTPYLMLDIIARLTRLFPEEAPRLTLLADNLAWKARVEPVG